MKVTISQQVTFSQPNRYDEADLGSRVVTRHLRIWFHSAELYRVEEHTSFNGALCIYVSKGSTFVVMHNGHMLPDPNGNPMALSRHNSPPYVRVVANPHLLHAGFEQQATSSMQIHDQEIIVEKFLAVPEQRIGADLMGPRLTLARTTDGTVLYWIEEEEDDFTTNGYQLSNMNVEIDEDFPWLSPNPVPLTLEFKPTRRLQTDAADSPEC